MNKINHHTLVHVTTFEKIGKVKFQLQRNKSCQVL